MFSSQYPDDWEIVPFTAVHRFNKGISITKAELVENGIAVINYGQIHAKNNLSVTTNPDSIRFAPANFDIGNVQPLKVGDLVFADTSEDCAGIGAFVRFDLEGTAFPGYHTLVARPHERFRHKYFSYLYLSDVWRDQVRQSAMGVKVYSITQSLLKQATILVPPEVQQNRIVQFLDHETAKIDHLIAKQQKLLSLTQEQAEANVEAAIWGQSIARGKNDSIAEHSYQPRSVLCLAVADRLSSIPESWDVQRFKRIFSRKDDRNIDLSLEMLSLRQTGAVVLRSETNQNQEPSEKSLPRYLAVSRNDLVVNPMWLTGGAIGVSGLSGAVSPDYRVFTIGTELIPAYAHEILRSISYRRQFKLFERASTTFDRRIQQIDLDNLPVPIPPVEHQKEIVRMVTQIHSHTQKLYEASERSIKLLQERRFALITAAVTGQIEV